MSYFAFDKFVPVVVRERTWREKKEKKVKVGRSFEELLSSVIHLRSVDDQSVPLTFDVVVWRLLCDVESGKLQLAGDFFLSLEHNQRNLWTQRHNLSSGKI